MSAFEKELTGRTRFRVGFRGKVILQVQVNKFCFGQNEFDSERKDVWEDATVESMTMLGISEAKLNDR